MFTGIVSEIGILTSKTPVENHLRLTIRAPGTATELKLGDSVNINGACQTVSSIDNDMFSVDTITETMKKTNLGELSTGSRLNLELALRASDRLGGHIVSGHIDCLGTVREISQKSSEIEVAVTYPPKFHDLIVPQGSIAINGVSLTVADLSQGMFKVAIIPTTWQMTTLADLRSGSSVNLEFDTVGKYIVRFLAQREPESKLTEKKLRELGY